MSDADDLTQECVRARVAILDMVFRAGSGHIDSSMSVVEILVALYFSVLNIRSDIPDWAERDRVVLSKGHAAPALYAVLARRGYFPEADLATLRRLSSHLQGHPAMGTPGVDVGTGSLGQGLSIAAGMALANERIHRASARRVYAVLSDGELNEGQTWEAAMMASHFHLETLTAVVDVNGLQYTGPTTAVMDLRPLEEKFAAFGWSVVGVDGHSIAELRSAFAAPALPGRPKAILARTVKGKGISFMENQVAWHGKVPDLDLYERARAELLGYV